MWESMECSYDLYSSSVLYFFEVFERVVDWCTFEIPQLEAICGNGENTHSIQKVFLCWG